MLHSSFDRARPPVRLAIQCMCAVSLLAPMPLDARKQNAESFAPALLPDTAVAPTSRGAIFPGASYVPLTSGARASRVGDIVTIVLVERTSASKTSSANTGRSGSLGLTPPATGILDLLKSTDVNMSGDQSFKGKGDAAQSNALSGEVSVTVAEVYSNGTMLVRGEKQLTLNRGDERVQISGILRVNDISADNRVASTRVADARIRYVGTGEIARASRQGWMQRFFSKISPF